MPPARVPPPPHRDSAQTAREKRIARFLAKADAAARPDRRSPDVRDIAEGRGPRSPAVVRQQEADRRAALRRKVPTLAPATTPRAPRLTRDEEIQRAIDVAFNRDPAFAESARRTRPRTGWLLASEGQFDPRKPTSWGALGLDVAGVLPPSWALTKGARAGAKGGAALLRGKGSEAAKQVARETYEAPGLTRRAASKVRTLTVGEKTVQLPRARSRTTRALIEAPADAISRALMGEGKLPTAIRRVPGLKTASAEQRVAKAAGRQQRLEAERAAAQMRKYERALPKAGSPADVAHFWWAQLPSEMRNASGLKLVRGAQAAELEDITSGRAHAALQAQMGAVRAQLRQAEEGERFQLLAELEELRLLAGDLPQRADDIARSLAELDSLIAKPPRYDARIVEAVSALSKDRERVLVEAGVLNPERAAARTGLVARWADVEPTGEEAYVGHRLGARVRGAQESLLPVSPGTGRARLPQGVSQENKLVLAKTGRLRPSTHVAAEDWRAAQTYQSALTARDDLGKMGKPFTGRIPEGHLLVNPKGRAVPAHMRDERLAKLAAHDDDEVRAVAEEIVKGFVADETTYKAMLAEAEKAGVQWDELRVVKKEIVDRYFGQFKPARASTKGGKIYDAAVDFVAASIVFARLGYIPKGIAGNLVMAVPHQGPFFLVNAPRAGQVLANTQLRDLIGAEVGAGASRTLAEEATHGKRLRGGPWWLASKASWVADDPLRISAFIHEAAAAKVIPKFKPVLGEADEAALIDLLTNPAKRALLNDVRSRSVEAMADFSRLTPEQRKWARRFLVVPGWLWAGSRYPFHFAATHPGRAAAIGYAAAGMPGADELGLPQTPAITDFMADDTPHYAPGFETPWGVLRTNPANPVSTPWEIALAAAQREGHAVADYANPLASAAWHLANRQATYPGGAYQTDTLTALDRFGQRVVPNYPFIRDLVSPSGEGVYPGDATRMGRIARELGVVPVEIRREGKRGRTASSSSEERIRKFMEKYG